MNDLLCWELKYQTCAYSEFLLKKICLQNETSNNKVDILQIKKAIYYAKKYHGSQKRLSGEPYYSHPLAVAELVAPYCFKTDILVTSILHDTIEDTNLTKDMLEYIFDANIASKVDDLTRVKFDRKISSAEMLELLWLQKKDDLLLVKFFDRLHNIQTIKSKSPLKIKKILDETFKDFIILASYLEIVDIEEKLKTLCLQIMFNRNLNTDSPASLFNGNFHLPFLIFENEIFQS